MGLVFAMLNDRIWGLFPPDTLSAKIYNDVKTLTEKYGSTLDILYDEPHVTASMLDKYNQVFYWNQTVT